MAIDDPYGYDPFALPDMSGETPFVWPPPEWGIATEPPPADPLDTYLTKPLPAPAPSPGPVVPPGHPPPGAPQPVPIPMPPGRIGGGPVAPTNAAAPHVETGAPLLPAPDAAPPQPPEIPIDQGTDLSGGGTLADWSLAQVEAARNQPPEIDMGQAEPGGPQDLSVEGLAAQYASLPPDQLELADARLQLAAATDARTKQLDAAREAHDQALLSWKSRQDGIARAQAITDKALADSDALANTPIDNDRWWHDRSTGQVIAGFIGAGIGGWLNPGGRNMTIEAISNAIDKDIAAQHADLANRGAGIQRRLSAAGQMYLQATDQYEAETKFQIASWERVSQMIAMEAQNYDPRSSSAIALAKVWQDAQARKQAAVVQAYDANVKRETAIAELQNKQLDAQAKLKKLTARPGAAEVISPEMSAALKGMGIDIAPGTKRKDLDYLLKTGKSVQDLSGGGPGAAIQEKQRQEAIAAGRANAPIAGLVTDKGEPIHFRTPATTEDVAKKKAALDTEARLLDQLIIAREKYGWSTDLFKSSEWRAMQADAGALMLAAKDQKGLGAISGADLELIDKTFGTKDPTELRDPTDTWKQARANEIAGFNDLLRAEGVVPDGHKVRQYVPPRLEAASATERTSKQNLDVFFAPEIDAPTTPLDIKRSAAGRAAASTDALARQLPLDELPKLAQANQSRLAQGIIDKDQAETVQKTIRKQMRRKIAAELSDLGFGKPHVPTKGDAAESARAARIDQLAALSQASDKELDAAIGLTTGAE